MIKNLGAPDDGEFVKQCVKQETLVHAPKLWAEKNFQESINYKRMSMSSEEILCLKPRENITKEMVKFRGVSKNEMTLYL